MKHADKAADRADKAEETRVRRWLRSTWKLLTQHIVIFCHKFVDHYLTYSLILIPPPPPRPLVLVYPHIARPVTCSRAPYVLILKNPQFLVIILLLMSFLLPNIHIDHPVSIKQIPSIYTSYTYPQKYPTTIIQPNPYFINPNPNPIWKNYSYSPFAYYILLVLSILKIPWNSSF